MTTIPLPSVCAFVGYVRRPGEFYYNAYNLVYVVFVPFEERTTHFGEQELAAFVTNAVKKRTVCEVSLVVVVTLPQP